MNKNANPLILKFKFKIHKKFKFIIFTPPTCCTIIIKNRTHWLWMTADSEGTNYNKLSDLLQVQIQNHNSWFLDYSPLFSSKPSKWHKHQDKLGAVQNKNNGPTNKRQCQSKVSQISNFNMQQSFYLSPWWGN